MLDRFERLLWKLEQRGLYDSTLAAAACFGLAVGAVLYLLVR